MFQYVDQSSHSQTMTVKAYAASYSGGRWTLVSIDSDSGASGSSYGVGLGVRSSGDDSSEGSKSYGMDSEKDSTYRDILVFDMGSNYSSYSNYGVKLSSSESDLGYIDMWYGGSSSSDFDFSSVCFYNCSSSDKKLDSSSGFTHMSSNPSYSKDSGEKEYDTSDVGRYLVVAPSCSSDTSSEFSSNQTVNKTACNDDFYFKIKDIEMYYKPPAPPPTGGKVPAPGSLPLLGLGLLALTLMRRRLAPLT